MFIYQQGTVGLHSPSFNSGLICLKLPQEVDETTVDAMNVHNATNRKLCMMGKQVKNSGNQVVTMLCNSLNILTNLPIWVQKENIAVKFTCAEPIYSQVLIR